MDGRSSLVKACEAMQWVVSHSELEGALRRLAQHFCQEYISVDIGETEAGNA